MTPLKTLCCRSSLTSLCPLRRTSQTQRHGLAEVRLEKAARGRRQTRSRHSLRRTPAQALFVQTQSLHMPFCPLATNLTPLTAPLTCPGLGGQTVAAIVSEAVIPSSASINPLDSFLDRPSPPQRSSALQALVKSASSLESPAMTPMASSSSQPPPLIASKPTTSADLDTTPSRGAPNVAPATPQTAQMAQEELSKKKAIIAGVCVGGVDVVTVWTYSLQK